MTTIALAEYDPAAPRQQLHALFKASGPVAAELGERLVCACPGLTVRYDAGPEMLLAAFPEGGDRAGFLRLLVAVLDGYADAPAGQAPELLETRLAPLGEPAPAPPFSRLLRLADEAALPGDLRPCLRLAHGTSFGSGRHPSTRLAMAALERLAAGAAFPARGLDVGCGSGILALACGLLGARQVLGIDIEAGALRLAAANAAANRLADRVGFSGQALAELSGPYQLLVANVTGAVMGGMVGDFARLVGPGGWLVISGLQGRQLDEMVATLGGLGFALVERFAEEPWRAGLLRWS